MQEQKPVFARFSAKCNIFGINYVKLLQEFMHFWLKMFLMWIDKITLALVF